MPAKDSTERALRNCSHFADQIELVVLQLSSHPGLELGHYIQGLWCEKAPLITCRDIQQRLRPYRAARLSACHSVRPPVHSNGRLTDKLVGGDPHRYGELQLLTYLPPDSCSHLLRRTEQTACAGEVEKCVTIAAGLDSWGVDPENFVQRA
jgi:hypothetical protein